MSKSDPVDFSFIEKLASLLSSSDLSEIEIEHETVRIRISRETETVQTVVQAPVTAVPAAPAPAATPSAPSPANETAPAVARGSELTSPMVGTAYLAPEPGAANFVSVGDKVKVGQTVLIIEAMKTMNQIAADKDGTIKEILIDNAQPVEFGEPLLIIE